MLITVLVMFVPPKRRKGTEADSGHGGQGGLYPELAAFRITEGCSPNVQAEVGRVVAQMPYRLAQEELARRGQQFDEKALQRIATELGQQMLATRTHDLELFHAGKLKAGTEFAGKRIAVQIDGGRVRVRTVVKKSRVGKTRKRRKFRLEWREPKVVVIFELDDDGRMKPGTRSVIDGTLGGADAIIELTAFHLYRLGAAEAHTVVFLGDGARWIWRRIDYIIAKAGLKPDRTFQVLDWCHAVHHLHLALEDLSLSIDDRRARFRHLRKLLKKGKSAAVIAELEALAKGLPSTRIVWREIRYFRHHQQANRLRYGVARYRRLPIGSGVVESTIRRVINLRLKGNGIFWDAENAEAIFQLRAALLSGRWEEIVKHTQDHVARNRHTDWQWEPPETLKELNALADDDVYEPESADATPFTVIAV